MATPEWLTIAMKSIDAGMFSGDIFYNEENRKELKEYIGRWEMEMESIAESLNQPESALDKYI